MNGVLVIYYTFAISATPLRPLRHYFCELICCETVRPHKLPEAVKPLVGVGPGLGLAGMALEISEATSKLEKSNLENFWSEKQNCHCQQNE